MAEVLAFLACFMLISGSVFAQTDQETINYLGNYLQIRYDVVSNFAVGELYDAKLTFTNTGQESITAGEQSWAIYFCHIRLIDPENIRNGGSDLSSSGLKAYHINGCMHMINTTSAFVGIEAGQELVIPFQAQYWMVSKSDSMPNWYVTAAGADPRVIESTAGESMDFVGPFDSQEKWKRLDFDTYNPYTGQDRYDLYDFVDTGSAQLPIIPTPANHDLDPQNTVNIGTGDWVVVLKNASLSSEAEYLADKLNAIVVDTGSAPTNRFISIDFNSDVNESDGYNLDIQSDPRSITIRGKDATGAWYGIQSLLSMAAQSMEIPSGTIRDFPRFPYRGMHLDVGRNFHGKDDVLKLLDVMSMYKLNKFHFHLTEDEGWRLEIPGLPELTTVGAHRCHDPSGDQCILPQLGSSPLKANDGSGFYTVEEYKEILQYAEMRHIEVIPEFDMPGHAHAAINAMLARYRSLMDQAKPVEAAEYLLSDFDDPSDYLSVQYFTDNAINPCVNGTNNFIRHIIREVKNMHSQIQPLKSFNFGGDEVPSGAWINSTACRNRGLYERNDIKEMLIMSIAEMTAAEGLDLSGWEDGYAKNSTANYDSADLATNTEYSYVWENVWEWGAAKNAYEFANNDYKVILAFATHVYFDHPHEPDPEERGYYWATRIAPIRKAFGLMPDDVYENIDIDRFGSPLNKDEICEQHTCPPLDETKRNNIIGIQGHLWTESVRKSDQLEYMIYPRILALAERAWHKASWETVVDPAERETLRTKDFENFANTLGYKELARLDEMDIQYAVPPPGARLDENNVLEVKSLFPGLPIQISSDSGQSWADVTSGRTLDAGEAIVVTRSANRGRISRSATITAPPLVAAAGKLASHWILVISALIWGIRYA